MKNQDDILKIIKFKDYFMFIFMPTLCFQLKYPRTSTIRIWFLLKRILEFTISMMIFFFIVAQYMMPIVNTAHNDQLQGKTDILTTIKNVIVSNPRS